MPTAPISVARHLTAMSAPCCVGGPTCVPRVRAQPTSERDMMMKLLVLTINYAPEPTGFAPHVTALCEYLAAQEHAVTVITAFPFTPFWERWPGYRGRPFGKESLNGVRVFRVAQHVPRRPGTLVQRLLLEGSFCFLAALVALTRFRSRWDGVLYVGAQPSIAMLARLVAWVGRVPYVVKITDLAAEAARDVGILRHGRLERVLSRFEYSAYTHARGAIVIADYFKDALVARGFPPARVRVIQNSEDLDSVRPCSDGNAFRAEHGLSPDDFVVLYSGSMGIKQGLTNVVKAARLLRRERPMVRWVLAGDGELKPSVEELIAEHNLAETVLLLPLEPKEAMARMFSAANLLLLNQLSSMKDTVIPGKLQTYMAAGKPILAAVNPSSLAAMLLRRSQGGVMVVPEDPEALAVAVTQVAETPEILEEMGRRNREYAEKHFDERVCLRAQEAFLLQMVGPRIEVDRSSAADPAGASGRR